MKKKAWVLLLIAGICFIFVGIMNFIDKNSISGVMFIVIGGFYFVISIGSYKTKDKSNRKQVPKTVLDNMDEQLRILVSESKKIEAIKKVKLVTGLGLKEAKDYVDNLK